MRTAAVVACVATLTACDLPRDAENTFTALKERGEMRVGVTEAPPWITRTSQAAEPSGIEADLIRNLARQHGVRVRWSWGPAEEHYAALERFDLDLVAGGLTDDTPWKTRVGLTRPYASRGKVRHVMAVPPGENRWLVIVEEHLRLHEHKASP